MLTLVQGDHSRRLLEDTTNDFRMTGPGRGILFTLPLSGVSGRVPQILEHIKEKEAAGMEEKREPTMEEEGKKVPFDLVLTVVERGNVDAVMQAASKAGRAGRHGAARPGGWAMRRRSPSWASPSSRRRKSWRFWPPVP